MTNITKAAQALRDLADWHWSQATTLRKAASATAMDKPEPCRSSLLRMADWHDDQRRLLAALQDKAGGVHAYGWPKLDKPATVGAGTFGVGVSSRLVVEAAQRAYKYKREHDLCTKEEMQADEVRRRSVWDMIHGSPTAQPAPVVPDDHPLMIFARECELGTYMEHETPMAARKAINAAKAYGTQPRQKGVRDDVVRYRTIRDGMVYIEPHESGEIYVAGETGVYTKSGDEFDAAIDAIAASKKKGSAG